jgi:hypothetical protein
VTRSPALANRRPPSETPINALGDGQQPLRPAARIQGSADSGEGTPAGLIAGHRRRRPHILLLSFFMSPPLRPPLGVSRSTPPPQEASYTAQRSRQPGSTSQQPYPKPDPHRSTPNQATAAVPEPSPGRSTRTRAASSHPSSNRHTAKHPLTGPGSPLVIRVRAIPKPERTTRHPTNSRLHTQQPAVPGWGLAVDRGRCAGGAVGSGGWGRLRAGIGWIDLIGDRRDGVGLAGRGSAAGRRPWRPKVLGQHDAGRTCLLLRFVPGAIGADRASACLFAPHGWAAGDDKVVDTRW